jgi:hypothetical protein
MKKVVTTVLEPPRALSSAAAYDAKRVQEALKYADSTLRNTRRKLSPLGHLLSPVRGGVQAIPALLSG